MLASLANPHPTTILGRNVEDLRSIFQLFPAIELKIIVIILYIIWRIYIFAARCDYSSKSEYQCHKLLIYFESRNTNES